MTLFKSAHGKVFRELYPDFPPNLSFEFQTDLCILTVYLFPRV